MSQVVELHIPCPSCTSSDGYCTYSDGHGYCFSCNYFKPFKGEALSDEVFTYEYIPWRGITKRTMEFYDVKTKVDLEGKPVSLGFKYPSGDYKVRLLDRKEFRWEPSGEKSKVGLFGRNAFTAGGHKYVTITEGELDALTLWQVLSSPVVSVSSSTNSLRDLVSDRDYLQSYERIYFAFDNDAAGREAVARCAKLFDYNKIRVLDFGQRKDANEYLQAGEEETLRNIWWNAKRYLPETVIAINQDNAKEILTQTPKNSVPYPFPTLNAMTYGLRRGESVLITAQEGVGKTELMHAIEYQLLKETDDAIGAIYLEEPKRRHLQALASCVLERPTHLPDSGCSDVDVLEAVGKAVTRDDRLHLYSHFGSNDPEVLLDTIRFMVSARDVVWVLLDHISMCVSGLSGEDERKALDYISTRLEMMVKELNFGLVIVSHVNDIGQTRGSRYISKVADIRIDAVRDLLAADSNIRNTTYLTVSKNRFSGSTGPAGKLIFDPFKYKYTEAANDNGGSIDLVKAA